jgi:hypothetical protein
MFRGLPRKMEHPQRVLGDPAPLADLHANLDQRIACREGAQALFARQSHQPARSVYNPIADQRLVVPIRVMIVQV